MVERADPPVPPKPHLYAATGRELVGPPENRVEVTDHDARRISILALDQVLRVRQDTRIGFDGVRLEMHFVKDELGEIKRMLASRPPASDPPPGFDPDEIETGHGALPGLKEVREVARRRVKDKGDPVTAKDLDKFFHTIAADLRESEKEKELGQWRRIKSAGGKLAFEIVKWAVVAILAASAGWVVNELRHSPAKTATVAP